MAAALDFVVLKVRFCENANHAPHHHLKKFNLKFEKNETFHIVDNILEGLLKVEKV